MITISDTRTLETDRSGRRIQELLSEAHHEIVSYDIIPDEPDLIQEHVQQAVQEADLVVLTGGTGISPRDNTVDALTPLLDRTLTGFGELFRMLSFKEIGAAAMLSGATAGICGDALVFALPGSPNAVSLALKELILPELNHLIGELRKVPT